MISNKHLQEFMKMYQKHFGEQITAQEALKKGLRLVRLIQAVYGPEKNNFENQQGHPEAQSTKAPGRMRELENHYQEA